MSAVIAALISAVVSAFVAVCTSRWARSREKLRQQAALEELRRRLEGDRQLQEARLRAELRTEYMAEEAVHALLDDPRWPKRSFDAIQDRVGGFDGDDLRRLLVRAGALRFRAKNGKELWGLRTRNPDDLMDEGDAQGLPLGSRPSPRPSCGGEPRVDPAALAMWPPGVRGS